MIREPEGKTGPPAVLSLLVILLAMIFIPVISIGVLSLVHL